MAFERGWASIPAELKVHTLSYALQSDGPVDCKMAEDMIKQSYPLFSEKFIDSAIAIEIFYGANTFQLRGTVIDGKPNFMLPPPHYRKYIHHVELHLIPNVELYTQVTSIDLKALFPLINSLKITVECDFSNTSMVSFLNTKVTELPPFNLDSLEIVFIPLPLRGIAATGWVYIHLSISIRCRTIRLLRLSGEILYTGMKCETVSGVHVERSWWVKKKACPNALSLTRLLTKTAEHMYCTTLSLDVPWRLSRIKVIYAGIHLEPPERLGDYVCFISTI